MKKCGCTFWKTCIPCGNRLGLVDSELSSYRIVQGMSRANTTAEDAIFRAEDRAAKFHLACDFLLCLGVIGLLIWICV